MSLTQVKEIDIVKKQYVFKLKAYYGIYSTLILIQLVAVLFSFLGGTSSFGGGNGNLNIEGISYSGNFVIMLTLIWAFTSAIILTTRAYRYDDFSFITNRLTSHLSNILFILTICFLGGFFAILSGFLIKDFIYLKSHFHFIENDRYLEFPGVFSASIIGTSLYNMLFCAAGYLTGTLVQLHKIFIILIPGVFFGLTFLSPRGVLFIKLVEPFYNESSLWLFALKVMITSAIVFAICIGISNRMEVRR